MATLVAATEILDRVFTGLTVLAAAWLLLDLVRARVTGSQRPGGPPPLLALSRRAELGCIAVILALSAVYRLAALSQPLTPAYWDSQVNTIMVDRMMKGAGLRATLGRLLAPSRGHSYFVGLAALLPIATFLQRVLGPSPELQGYIGAVLSLGSIALAWMFGRRYRGPLFGVFFAAFLSTSLMQLLWSRLGGTYLGGTLHVLAVVLLGFEAGRRNSVVFAVLAGVLTWLCFYNHFQARVCLPLLYVALAAGAAGQPRAFRRTAVLAVLVTLVLAGAYARHNNGSLRATIWPDTGGEVGNQGERTVADLIEKNLAPSAARLAQCIRIAFVDHRGSLRGWGWGLDQGGNLLVPAIVFGCIGLAYSLARMRSGLLPLAITALGLSLAVLSEAQVRKLLIFDLGWQFLAAIGLYEVLRHRLLAARRPRTLLLAGGVAYAVIGGWGFAALGVTTLRAGTMSMPFRQFALPLFGDVFDAPKTFPVAKRWEAWMRQGFAVFFVNSDSIANNFATYGGIAALGAGREAYFRSFHPLDSSANLPTAGLSQLLGRDRTISESLLETVRQMGARGVVWWFERPTRWDQWLIAELVRHGGTTERWAPADSGAWGTPSTYVVLEGAALAGAMTALDALDIAHDDRAALCLELSPGERRPLPPLDNVDLARLVNAVVPARSGCAARRWVFLTNEGIFVGNQAMRTETRPVAVAPIDRMRLAVMDAGGVETVLSVDPNDASFTRKPRVPLRPGQFIGANCAARVGDDWWLVDPLEGTLSSNQPTGWIPARPWIAVAGDGERLVLASADQQVAVLRPATREVERVFPAHVWESYKSFDFGSCPVIRILDGYIASFDLSTSLVALYTMEGRQVAALRLADAVDGLIESGVNAIDVSDASLVFTEVRSLPLSLPMAKVYSHAISAQGTECKRGVRLAAPCPTGTPSPAGPVSDVEVSGVRPFFVDQACGAPVQGRTVVGGELRGAGDRPTTGIGVQARSVMMFSLKGRFRRFHAYVGPTQPPDESTGSVAFEVVGDGRPLWGSDVLRAGAQPRACDVDVHGVDVLELRVTDGGDGIAYDQAAWFEPVLE